MDFKRAKDHPEEALVERQWAWFRYIAKQLDKKALFARTKNERPRFLRELLRVWPYQSMLPVEVGVKLTGVSAALRGRAQRAAGYEFWLFWERRAKLYDGRELDAWRGWDEEQRRHRRLTEIFPTLRGLDGVPPPPPDFPRRSGLPDDFDLPPKRPPKAKTADPPYDPWA